MEKAYPKPFDRITVDPEKLGGKPCIRGMRLSVRHVLNLLVAYDTRDDLYRDFPYLEEEDLRQAVLFAETVLDEGRVPQIA